MFRTVCFSDIHAALPLWQSDEPSVYGVAQSALWSKHWQQNVNPDCVVLALFIDERPALLLPLEVVKQGKATIARFAGGSHANCNFPVLFISAASQINNSHIADLIACFKKARPDIDLISLTRQMPNWLGYENPLLGLNHQLNPNPALMASLPDKFDTVLERGNAARRRKKHRHHARRYEAAGAWRVYMAATEAESSAAFDAFFAMKSKRLASQGIANSFADHGIEPFLKQLFSDPDNHRQRQYRLHILEVANKPRAIIGCAYWQLPAINAQASTASQQRGVTVEFTAFADDDLASASPGDFLFHESVASAIEQGLDFFSFGIGEEKYKRDWCDIELPLYDSHIAVSTKGRLSAGLQKMRSALITRIKNNRHLWALVKKLRQTIGAKLNKTP